MALISLKNSINILLSSNLSNNESILEVFELLAFNDKGDSKWILDFDALKHFTRDYCIFD